MDLLPVSHFYRLQPLGQLVLVQLAKDTQIGVGVECSQVPGQIKLPMELTGLAADPFFHIRHRRLHDSARFQRHKHGGIHVVDAMAQGGEHTGLRVIEGHCSDARH